VNRSEGQPPIKLMQTEDVQFKLDGLVMVIEGTGRNGNGDTAFQALATISCDDATSTYHFRAYNEGRYLDTELNVTRKGFSWGFPAGPAKIGNAMELNANGEWAETTQITFGTSAPRTSVSMLLHRVSPPGVDRFDGHWLTTVSCDPARDALGYSFRFVSDVKNGNLRGLYGAEGEPSSLLIEGKVSADGAAKLYASGRTGSKEFVPGRDTPRGSQYNYNIEAHFNDEAGSGVRVEGRHCSFQFQKQ
jgi:hypothetical protein